MRLRRKGRDASPSRSRRRARWMPIILLVSVALIVAGFIAGRTIQSPADAALSAKPPSPDLLTAPVVEQVLTSTVVIRGTAAADNPVTIGSPAPDSSGASGKGGGGKSSAGSVVTWMGVRAGDSVQAGKVLVELSGRPLFVMQGDFPAYRDMKPGESGRDIAQLQSALRGLGYSIWDTSGYYGSSTKAAVSAFYSRRGYTPIPANPDGDQQISTARVALEQAQTAYAAAAPADKHSAQIALQAAQQTLMTTEQQNGPTVPMAEVLFVRHFPVTVGSIAVRVGDTVTGAVMQLTTGSPKITGYLKSDQLGLVHAGMHVQIANDLTGFTAEGVVTTVSSEQAMQGSGAQAVPLGYPVTINPTKDLPSSLIGQDLRLTVQTASTSAPVLTVPISAITTNAAGQSTVILLAGRNQQRIVVTTGATANGYVQVTDPSGQLTASSQVVTGVK